ncbi:uncharacterized protein TNCV_1504591 [Trichonephila clavipes]|uniref:Uncharacterized protein n=1 Tax=Trichonephila clavipes TaxID=2585209 RepID=A0A8X6V908_TRICX|nr:uncharacterized protein TNCV_1504591 [Trichonephila clavipes]
MEIQRQFLLATRRKVPSQAIQNGLHVDDLYACKTRLCIRLQQAPVLPEESGLLSFEAGCKVIGVSQCRIMPEIIQLVLERSS